MSAGNPTLSNDSIILTAEIAPCVAGLKTTALPEIKAGAILATDRFTG